MNVDETNEAYSRRRRSQLHDALITIQHFIDPGATDHRQGPRAMTTDNEPLTHHSLLF